MRDRAAEKFVFEGGRGKEVERRVRIWNAFGFEYVDREEEF